MESLNQKLACGGLTAHFEPEDAEGQSRINGRLSFRRVHSKNGEGCLAFAQRSTGVDRAKRFFQVDGGGQAGDGKAGKVAIEGAAQLLLITGAGSLFCRGRTPVALTANFQPAGTRLAKPLHGQL